MFLLIHLREVDIEVDTKETENRKCCQLKFISAVTLKFELRTICQVRHRSFCLLTFQQQQQRHNLSNVRKKGRKRILAGKLLAGKNGFILLRQTPSLDEIWEKKFFPVFFHFFPARRIHVRMNQIHSASYQLTALNLPCVSGIQTESW